MRVIFKCVAPCQCLLYGIMWLSFCKKVLIWWECDSLLTEQLNQTLWLDINIIIRIRAHLLVDLWILDVRKTLSSHRNSKSLLSRFGQNQFSSKPKLLHNWLERLQILTKIRFCLKVWGCCYWTAHSDETLWPLYCLLRWNFVASGLPTQIKPCGLWTAHSDKTLWPLDCPLR